MPSATLFTSRNQKHTLPHSEKLKGPAFMTLGTSGFACCTRLEHGGERTLQQKSASFPFVTSKGSGNHLNTMTQGPSIGLLTALPLTRARPSQEQSRQSQAKDKMCKVHT